jgi:hypothetical protein
MLRLAKPLLWALAFVITLSLPGLLRRTTFADSQSAAKTQRASAPASSPAEDPQRKDYVGTDTCASCHSEIAATYRLTNHNLTSSLPSATTLKGSFASGSNTMSTVLPDLTFRMDQRGNNFFETAISGDPPHAKERREPIDIVIGTGEKGQTFLYWHGDQLLQLPISHWRDVGWINSPGYLDGTADFDRQIPPRCLECHATYARSLEASLLSNRYDKNDVTLNLSCERCHGPGRQHVEKYRAAQVADAGTGAAGPLIVNPAKLERARQIEVCGQCHGGAGKDLVTAFSYIPGEKLLDFIELPAPDPKATVDVHGNQMALLERSRCYQESPNLTCITCHNPHEAEKPAATYSTKCLGCHEAKSCGEFARLGDKISENCIDCHMPMQSSKVIVSALNGKQVSVRVRNHWIRVYSNSGETQ